MEEKSGWEIYQDLNKEAEATQEFSRSVYKNLGSRDFFQQAVLRSLALIVKLLLRINEKL